MLELEGRTSWLAKALLAWVFALLWVKNAYPIHYCNETTFKIYYFLLLWLCNNYFLQKFLCYGLLQCLNHGASLGCLKEISNSSQVKSKYVLHHSSHIELRITTYSAVTTIWNSEHQIKTTEFHKVTSKQNNTKIHYRLKACLEWLLKSFFFLLLPQLCLLFLPSTTTQQEQNSQCYSWWQL